MDNQGKTPEPPDKKLVNLPAKIEEKASLRAGSRGLMFSTINDVWRFAQFAAGAEGFVPKSMVGKPETIVVAIQFGMEIGLSPMGALRSVAVINGRAGIYGDAALALVRSSGVLESYEEHMGRWCDDCETESEDMVSCPRCKQKMGADHKSFVVTSKRKDQSSPVISGFNVKQAKQAGLWDKRGKEGQTTPWVTYPNRMLKFRARGFNLRDNFGDVLSGIKFTEELADYDDGEVIEHSPAALPPVGRIHLNGAPVQSPPVSASVSAPTALAVGDAPATKTELSEVAAQDELAKDAFANECLEKIKQATTRAGVLDVIASAWKRNDWLGPKRQEQIKNAGEARKTELSTKKG